MKHGSLFTGIGMFDYAAEQLGFENVFHCEINKFCNKILNFYWPNVLSFSDIKNLTVDDYGNLLYICEKGEIMGQPKSSKYDNAVQLYESGLTVRDCALFFEISHQAMYKILKRRGCNFRKQLMNGEDNVFYRGKYGNQDKKKRVQHLVEKAISKGILIQPEICSICNDKQIFKDGRSGIQAHHNDYDKPLDVEWMCQKCHHAWHKDNKAINVEDEDKKSEPTGAIDVLSGGFP